MADPKYLKKYLADDEAEPSEKAMFSFRLDRTKLEKLKIISKKIDKPISEILNQQINGLLQDKILTNTYLADEKRIYFYVPTDPQFKQSMTADPGRIQKGEYLAQNDLLNYNKNYDVDVIDIDEDTFYWASGEPLQVKLKYIPNNLDIWDNTYFNYSMNADNKRHHGIETAILTETENNTNYLINCLYFFYIIYDDSTRRTNIYLISSTDALNLAKSCENLKLLNHMENLIADMEIVEDVDELEALANKYNTGNISRLQKNKENGRMDKIEDIIYKENENMDVFKNINECEKLINDLKQELAEIREIKNSLINIE